MSASRRMVWMKIDNLKHVYKSRDELIKHLNIYVTWAFSKLPRKAGLTWIPIRFFNFSIRHEDKHAIGTVVQGTSSAVKWIEFD